MSISTSIKLKCAFLGATPRMNNYVASHLTIIERCIEKGDMECIEIFMPPAVILATGSKDVMLSTRFKRCKAFHLDINQSFLDAAEIFYGLSLNTNLLPHEGLNDLAQQLLCTILAPGTKKRLSMLNSLCYEDMRTKNLPAYSLLERIVTQKIVTLSMWDSFNDSLMPHHKKQVANGSLNINGILFKHNMLSLCTHIDDVAETDCDAIIDTLNLNASFRRKLNERGGVTLKRQSTAGSHGYAGTNVLLKSTAKKMMCDAEKQTAPATTAMLTEVASTSEVLMGSSYVAE